MKLTVPFYLNKAGAGFPSPATDYIEEDIDLNIHLIKNVPATFIIRVQGKSMTDVGIYDGDLLVVDKSLKPKNFSTVVANVHDELVVKNFVKEKDEQFLTSSSKKIEDKIVKFSDKTRHQIFLEPEGLNDKTVYPNGISTSLPADVQAEILSKINGLERVKIIRPGYAIEYDYVDPRELLLTLETKKIQNLFLH